VGALVTKVLLLGCEMKAKREYLISKSQELDEAVASQPSDDDPDERDSSLL
jgi:outer membrane murein-binding lipoprotein Lpp